jgi:hypothetical protein
VPRQRDVFYQLVDPQREQFAIDANHRRDQKPIPVLA